MVCHFAPTCYDVRRLTLVRAVVSRTASRDATGRTTLADLQRMRQRWAEFFSPSVRGDCPGFVECIEREINPLAFSTASILLTSSRIALVTGGCRSAVSSCHAAAGTRGPPPTSLLTPRLLPLPP